MYLLALDLRASARFACRFAIAIAISTVVINSAICQDLVKSTYYEKSTADIIKVEEDWELVVAEPDPNSSGPQVTCVISPFSDASFIYATFEINHKSLSSDKSGGIQVQLWEYDIAGGASTQVDTPVLSVAGEIIRWTQRMSVVNGNLKVEVVGGSSASYGDFGKSYENTSSTDSELMTMEGYTVVYVDGTYQKVSSAELKAIASNISGNLNAYSPQVSIANSGVNYGSNLVSSLTLKRVRKYKSDGRMTEDNTSRSVVLP